MIAPLLLLTALASPMADAKRTQMLFPVVRIEAKNSFGSGTVIYSKGDDQTLILTNWHIVKNNKKVKVELFAWLEDKIVQRRVIAGEVLVKDRSVDLAVIRLMINGRNWRVPWPYTVTLATKKQIKKLKIFDKVYTIGCSLGNVPVPSKGEITNISRKSSDGKFYISANAPVTYGNSGGGLFTKIDGQYVMLGVPSRIGTLPWGETVPHIGIYIPATWVREFLKKNDLAFAL